MILCLPFHLCLLCVRGRGNLLYLFSMSQIKHSATESRQRKRWVTTTLNLERDYLYVLCHWIERKSKDNEYCLWILQYEYSKESVKTTQITPSRTSTSLDPKDRWIRWNHFLSGLTSGLIFVNPTGKHRTRIEEESLFKFIPKII